MKALFYLQVHACYAVRYFTNYAMPGGWNALQGSWQALRARFRFK